jgi:hypothetical protein
LILTLLSKSSSVPGYLKLIGERPLRVEVFISSGHVKNEVAIFAERLKDSSTIQNVIVMISSDLSIIGVSSGTSKAEEKPDPGEQL